MSTIDQKEYLKKYLRVGKAPGEKKKKKKSKGISKGLKIVDDNDLPSIEEEIKQDLANDDEDTPQIVAIIDDRPPSLRIDEEHKKLWKPIVEIEDEDIKPDVTQSLKLSSSFKLNKLVKSEENYIKREKGSSFKKPSNKRVKEEPRYDDYDNGNSKISSPIRKIKDEPLSPDSSPLRRKECSTIDSDSSPPRRIRKNSDSSPPRKAKRDSSPSRKTEQDSSPPRRRIHDSSPPRRSRKNSDSSPPRKSKRDSSPSRKTGHDSSPPRRTRRNSNSSPSRRAEHDISPPRRKRKNSDSSPPRKKKYNGSPPRKNRHESSPSRQNKYDSSTSSNRPNHDSKHKRKHDEEKDNQSPKRRDKKSRWGSQDEETTEKMKTTLDGKKSGLQRATELIQEMERIKKQEEEMFKNISSEISGQNAATIVRGKKRDAEDIEEEKRKQQKEKEMKEKYNKWGKGLKQVEDINEKIASDIHEMNKPLARYADDEDLEKYLKEQEREGDPMLAYLRKKKKKKAVEEKVPEKPMYMGEFMPNRFGIRPGYRWDGVDRSNGYEKKWFEVQNKKKASLEESYKWSTEDM